jgi:1-acyl-sn-glycerol-3-phosphate acyltransferase
MLFLGVRVFDKHNVPKRGGVLLLSNHQSFFDPLLAAMGLPRECHFMARDSLFTNPAFGWLITSVNAFPIKRGTADMRAIKEIMRRLKAGMVVVAFPEGTRSTDGKVGPFLPGMTAAAMKTKATIVPVRIDGAYRAWPRHRKWPTPTSTTVRYGQPLRPEEMDGYTAQSLSDEMRRRVIALSREISQSEVDGAATADAGEDHGA